MAQEVPSVCFWRKGLPVQGSSLWHGLGAEDFHKCMDAALAPLSPSSIPAEVQETIASARAPATKKFYFSQMEDFSESWCLAHAVDQLTALLVQYLELLQE